MKIDPALIVGIGCLLLSVYWACSGSLDVDRKQVTRLAGMYSFVLIVLTITSLGLCAAGPLEWYISVNAYMFLFNLYTVLLISLIVLAVMLLIKSRGAVRTYLISIVGGIITFLSFGAW